MTQWAEFSTRNAPACPKGIELFSITTMNRALLRSARTGR